jgi:hypothetical protein
MSEHSYNCSCGKSCLFKCITCYDEQLYECSDSHEKAYAKKCYDCIFNEVVYLVSRYTEEYFIKLFNNEIAGFDFEIIGKNINANNIRSFIDSYKNLLDRESYSNECMCYISFLKNYTSFIGINHKSIYDCDFWKKILMNLSSIRN